MAAPEELDHLIGDLQRQRDVLREQIDAFTRRERTTTELLHKLRELRERADDTARVKFDEPQR
jgi:ribosomal 50S subunit-associated protein YjgA (DUF615 family)